MNFSWPIETPELRAGELTLVPWKNAHTIPNVVEDLVESCVDERMTTFTMVPLNYTKDMAESFLGDHDVVRWALVHDGRYCGNIELRLDNQEFAHINVGYATAPWARGKGLMTTALRLVRDHAFSQGAFRFEVKANVDNAASRHVAEASGFRFEGIQRGGEILRGKVNDLAVYALLSTDDVASGN